MALNLPSGLSPTASVYDFTYGNVSLFTDAGATTPASGGDAVYTVKDSTGNGVDLSQPAAGQRPLYLADTAVVQAGLFCDTGKKMPVSGVVSTQSFAAFFSYSQFNASVDAKVLLSAQTGGIFNFYITESGGFYYLSVYDGTVHQGSIALQQEEGVIGVVASPTALTFYVDGQSETLAPLAAGTASGIDLGNSDGLTQQLNGNLIASVIDSSVPTTPQINAAIDICAGRLMRKKVWFVGNSLTSLTASGATDPAYNYVPLTQNSLNAGKAGADCTTVFRRGIPGRRTDEITAALGTDLASFNFLAKYASKRRIVIWEITNTLTLGGASASQALTDWAALISTTRANFPLSAGKITAVTCIQRPANENDQVGGVTFEQRRQIVNAAMVENANKIYGDRIIPLHAQATVANRANDAVLIVNDNIHHTNFLHAINASMQTDALQQDVGSGGGGISRFDNDLTLVI